MSNTLKFSEVEESSIHLFIGYPYFGHSSLSMIIPQMTTIKVSTIGFKQLQLNHIATHFKIAN